jgi:hypothetical protein
MCGNLPDEEGGKNKYKGAMEMKSWGFYFFCTFANWGLVQMFGEIKTKKIRSSIKKKSIRKNL